jgi:hypothetical protein
MSAWNDPARLKYLPHQHFLLFDPMGLKGPELLAVYSALRTRHPFDAK